MIITGVIPARFKSSRFEGKPLALINSKPMIIHVAEQVEKALGRENTYVATDDLRIKSLVESYKFKVVMTSENCRTGTDRVWDFAKKIKSDIYLNVQGDEPMVSPMDIKKIVEVKKEYMKHVINGMLYLSRDEKPSNINIPKVLINKNSELVYMSRLPIPGIKDVKNTKSLKYLKQVCIYAFNYDELKVFGENNKKSHFEFFEDIEILRFLDFNIPIKMVMMEKETIAVDNPEDIQKVEAFLNKK